MLDSLPAPERAAGRRPCGSRLRFWPVLGVLALLALLAGCSSVGYYAQAVHGHSHIMRSARPVEDWLTDPATQPKLRQRLQLAQQLRDFASIELALPDNRSYRRYAALDRPYAVWNVVAAPPDSLQPRPWCFAVVGCVSYRGYFDPARAHALAQRLQAEQGLETHVYGVPAYSTLGRLNWAGGDPLLSTFVLGPESQLAGLLLHELAHQQLYVRGDTPFNESYASAVERLGLEQWMRSRASPEARQEHAALQARRQDFARLTRGTRQALAELYAQKDALPTAAVQARKAEIMARFRQDYATLREPWLAQGLNLSRTDAWVAGANNASFALLATYDGWVPAFQVLFEQTQGDWPTFHAHAQALAALPLPERTARLQALTDSKP